MKHVERRKEEPERPRMEGDEQICPFQRLKKEFRVLKKGGLINS